jgi:hypothetical protein
MDRRLISQIALIVLVAILQNTRWLSLGGININLVLILVVALAFIVRHWSEYFLLVILAAIFLKSENFWDWSSGIFIITSFLVYLGRKFSPWRSLVSYPLLALLATVTFYLALDWRFVKEDYLILLRELVYNLIFGGLLYLILTRFYDEETRIKF